MALSGIATDSNNVLEHHSNKNVKFIAVEYHGLIRGYIP